MREDELRALLAAVRNGAVSPAEAAVRVQEPDLGELITRFGKSLHKSAA